MNDHELAAELAATAGRMLLELRATQQVERGDEPAARELARRADRLSNDWLISELAARRPADAVLSEESEDDPSRVGAPRVWIIDPVDGTYEFARQLADFAVHIALWDNAINDFVAAAVSVPEHGVVWSTGAAPEPAQPTERTHLTVVSSARESAELRQRVAAALTPAAVELGYAGVEFRQLGSVGGKVHQLLAGRADVYFNTTGFWEWDAAAPAAVAAHLGLTVSDLRGATLRFNQLPPRVDSFVVARPHLHAPLIAALGELPV